MVYYHDLVESNSAESYSTSVMNLTTSIWNDAVQISFLIFQWLSHKLNERNKAISFYFLHGSYDKRAAENIKQLKYETWHQIYF